MKICETVKPAKPGSWLVVGGAGYIGSHVIRRLRADRRGVVALDDLSTGDAARVPGDVPLVIGSVADRTVVSAVLREHRVDGVIHLAARKSATESVAYPRRYYRDNVEGMRILLDEMIDTGVKRFLLSSSAAVYGVPNNPLVTETTPTAPISPYGETKLICEWLLRSAGTANGLSWVALRYFNVVGAVHPLLADTSNDNLFPLVFQEVTAGRPAMVTGIDYQTKDGTGVRDYVHIADVADAHAAAVERLERQQSADIYNVGTGVGYSVLEVLDAIRAVSGLPVEVTALPRRPGDAPEIVANVDKIAHDLAWKARHDLNAMVRSAWQAWSRLDTASAR
ncbi:UDP-glucose 4-epimerase GalE [Amycolatopsis roodepoortensis]|uniref:UDP-glucose 4-epimerase GalE n=1 Tax=Amycolatopsis roodepoortensis TaxID=700274 RepID=UPI00214B78A3|nr:UDP-glucose 4-epimerase GalE [Amycolatopsis roodepoortensis]UUV31592.1 UDP-glucose 4-epimerase GalE [Amycolatopsis roodepoortensis]